MIIIKKIKEILEYYFNIISLVFLIFLFTGVCYLLYLNINKEPKNNTKLIDILPKKKEINNNIVSSNIKVDIKGAVKNPGVYEVSSKSNVSDLIELAGGLNKNASTSNINLSRILEDQMVIKIYTASELKKKSIENSISECVCKDVDITNCLDNGIIKQNGENINVTSSDLSNNKNTSNTSDEFKSSIISINTATKEELMSISGIGESKALAIIEYRNVNGNFKSIEDIKNVTGIGDSLFEKIKEYITI